MKNTIMGSHEIYCIELQSAVKSYSDYDLHELIKKSLNINNHSDYVKIYQNEVNRRENILL